MIAYYSYNNQCLNQCPKDYYADNTTAKCVTSCPTNPLSFKLAEYHLCVYVCPYQLNLFADF
jgi:hypothetical protein